MTESRRRWTPSALVAASILLHLMAAGMLLVWPIYWRWALGAVAANQILLLVLGLLPRSTWLGRNWSRLPADAAARHEVALTFDDGPDPTVTPKVLDILDRYGAKASFFCIGENAQRYPELCKEIVRRGHAVENHSQNHWWRFALLGLRGMAREIATCSDAIVAITGQRPLFFRPTAGLRSPLLDPALCRCGLRLASWTRRGFDTRERNAEVIIARLLRGLKGGDILVLHDGNAARTTAGIPVILVALPSVLDAIKAARLHCVTLRSVIL